MFSRILIANRGEIALRIIRTCKEMGIETVAVYSKADENSMHIRVADEAICIGPGPSGTSYLDIPRLISAAEVADVDAVHPGYGFLAENSHFAEICESCNIRFIGPSPKAISLMGDKARAKELAIKTGLPVIPGSRDTVTSDDEAVEVAHAIGYPIIIKAVAGGGGRGMRVAHNDISLVNALKAAQAEADAAFKNPAVYIEKYIERPRHVEIQVLGDADGRVIHLGERDCSIQRRHQKLIEESPCPVMTEEMRREMGAAAVKLATAGGYSNAGTVEFLVDKDMKFYFIEMNARIQVEHPVTEMVTGLDLIREQIRIAAGEPMTIRRQEDVVLRGHSIEVRINAEDPDNNFKPSPGTVGHYYAPGGLGVRLDSHVYSGYRIPPLYDSMVGKLIVFRSTREEAVRTMRRALAEFQVEGIKTTIPLLKNIISKARFLAGKYDTHFVEELLG